MSETKEWMCGYYNVCVPVYVPSKRVLIRIPLPYKLGKERNSGNVEEKLRCEAATFIWIKEQCPQVPIPYLWGFGFPSGQCVRGLINRDCNSYILTFFLGLSSLQRPRTFRFTPGFCGIFDAMYSLCSAIRYLVATPAVDIQTP